MATTAKVLAAELKAAQLTIAENESYIAQLEEALRLANQRHFGVSSEQVNPNQTDLFADNIVPKDEGSMIDAPASTAPVHGYSRKTRMTKTEKLANLPKEYVHYHCSDQERICTDCGEYMSEFGIKTIRINIRYQPEELVAQHHVAHAYECKYCKTHAAKANIKTAKVTPAFIPTSFASESLVGEILYQKFVLGTPLNRQIPTFADLGLELNRNTMANWGISTGQMLLPFWQVMKAELLKEPVLHADETPTQILQRSDGRVATAKSRTWVIQSKLDTKRKGVVYETTLSRSYDAAMTVLGDFQGTLFTDGYQVYQMLDGVQHANCWAHVRRPFTTIMTNDVTARQFVHLIDQLFVIEQGLTKATPERRMAVRLEKSKPIVDEFWQLITKTHALPKSQLGKAIAYASKLQDNLNRFLYDGDIALSNNIAERSIRPITLGRKNWYFSTSEAGAQANDIMNSIVQSARANNLNVKKYLLYLLETVTTIGKWGRTDRLEAYLPWHPEIIQQFGQL